MQPPGLATVCVHTYVPQESIETGGRSATKKAQQTEALVGDKDSGRSLHGMKGGCMLTSCLTAIIEMKDARYCNYVYRKRNPDEC
jgi:hypothetical protein